MIPVINTEAQIDAFLKTHPESQTLAPKAKKKYTQKKWSPDFQLLSTGTPQIRDQKGAKKLLKIQFHYRDNSTKKVHSAVVFFGDADDYIFSGDKELRVKRILKLRDKDNPFSGDYWRAHLTLRYPTLAEGLAKFNEFFIQKNNEMLLKKAKPLAIN